MAAARLRAPAGHAAVAAKAVTTADAAPVIVVNAGSSTLKVRVLGPADSVESSLDLDPWDGGADPPELADFLARAADAVVVGHRVVHGGSTFSRAVLIDDAVVAEIADLTDLAPLHQPRALAGITAARRALPGVPGVACFDTAFHAEMPPAAACYALPEAWTRQFGLRRYGFHGLSHGYAARRAAELLGRDVAGLRLVTCHLGAGASLAAVWAGRSVDTTMGFTPLEGLVMATRSGSVDPGLITWLLQSRGLGLTEVAAGLEQSAGLAGLSGIPSGDMRAVLQAADSGDERGQLALDVYLHRLRREIAAMASAMNGLDALVFTGGVGEHSPRVRAAAVAGLEFLGVSVSPAQDGVTSDGDISGTGPARVLVVTAREDLEIARQARAALAAAT
jgi:acetate kinase